MRHYEELARYETNGFEVILDKTWEDLHPRDCFDDSCYDIDEICRKIDTGYLDWFMLRARVLLDDHQMGVSYIGGCLYEDPAETLKDGIADDCVAQAMQQAKQETHRLRERLLSINVEAQAA